MSNKRDQKSFFERLKAGLEDSIAYSKGELSLVTTTLPAPPPRLAATQVRSIRGSLRMSQAVFAATLNVSKKTVQSWEHGARKPSDAALRMLDVIQREPSVVDVIFADRATGTVLQARKCAPTTRARTRSRRRVKRG